MGERTNIIDTMHRVLADHGLADQRGVDQYVLHGRGGGERIVGWVIGKGLAGDEMGERAYLVVDGVDAQVHHIAFADPACLDEVERNTIVEVVPAVSGPRPSDRNISIVAKDGAGIYLQQQVTSDGATWLDRELVTSARTPLIKTGFGREVAWALDRRAERLVGTGQARREPDGAFGLPHNLVTTLERQEVERVGKEMAVAREGTFQPVKASQHVSAEHSSARPIWPAGVTL